jgi:hypothetical protein
MRPKRKPFVAILRPERAEAQELDSTGDRRRPLLGHRGPLRGQEIGDYSLPLYPAVGAEEKQ